MQFCIIIVSSSAIDMLRVKYTQRVPYRIHAYFIEKIIIILKKKEKKIYRYISFQRSKISKPQIPICLSFALNIIKNLFEFFAF